MATLPNLSTCPFGDVCKSIPAFIFTPAGLILVGIAAILLLISICACIFPSAVKLVFKFILMIFKFIGTIFKAIFGCSCIKLNDKEKQETKVQLRHAPAEGPALIEESYKPPVKYEDLFYYDEIINLPIKNPSIGDYYQPTTNNYTGTPMLYTRQLPSETSGNINSMDYYQPSAQNYSGTPMLYTRQLSSESTGNLNSMKYYQPSAENHTGIPVLFRQQQSKETYSRA